jgi:hypothetical protein
LRTETEAPPRAAYERDGFFLAEQIVPAELIARASRALDELAAEETYRKLPPTALRKMDNKHITNAVVRELVGHAAIGRLVAEVTGASMVQAFASQALVKPTGGADNGNVGWHQDLQYWQGQLRGELLTAWVAISDVTAGSGPMRFVTASHTWGLLNVGDFFSGDMGAIQARLRSARADARWDEVAAVLKPGAVSLHHNLTVHGSGPNLASWPRKSVAIHLRTEKSSLADGVKFGDVGWLNDFADEVACPVLYRRKGAAR